MAAEDSIVAHGTDHISTRAIDASGKTKSIGLHTNAVLNGLNLHWSQAVQIHTECLFDALAARYDILRRLERERFLRTRLKPRLEKI